MVGESALVARASISDLEVGCSARNADEFDSLIGALDAFVLVEIEPPHFRRARQVQRLLAAHGLCGRKVPDLLIALAAESNNLTVVHYDSDFEHIASITGQATAWIVPPGTIDSRPPTCRSGAVERKRCPAFGASVRAQV